MRERPLLLVGEKFVPLQGSLFDGNAELICKETENGVLERFLLGSLACLLLHRG